MLNDFEEEPNDPKVDSNNWRLYNEETVKNKFYPKVQNDFHQFDLIDEKTKNVANELH